MRRKRNTKRLLAKDPKFQDELVAKFINNLMEDGKKNAARSVMYDALTVIAKKEKEADPVAVFHTAMSNVAPLVEVKSRRVGGANYQVPIEVRASRKNALAMRWIIDAARGKKGRPMALKLADELLLAFKKEGEAMKKRENVHRMAEANKAFAHFAW
ncbi:MAG: 30S ribosomal protein S7 [Patescibacteria group bacterium]